jgi:hypothetical protein
MFKFLSKSLMTLEWIRVRSPTNYRIRNAFTHVKIKLNILLSKHLSTKMLNLTFRFLIIFFYIKHHNKIKFYCNLQISIRRDKSQKIILLWTKMVFFSLISFFETKMMAFKNSDNFSHYHLYSVNCNKTWFYYDVLYKKKL